MSESPGTRPALPIRWIEAVGAIARGTLDTLASGVAYIGGVARMLGAAGERTTAGVMRRGPAVHVEHLAAQSFRFGVRSIPIILLVHLFIGLILALNMAPTLASYGQTEQVATIVAIAVVRELGPLFTAILLSGLAGASIAAELGSMVEGEEIKALKAHALDPLRFLVAPRIIAAVLMTVGLTVIANVIAIIGGAVTGIFVLHISYEVYVDLTRTAITTSDYFTGLSKAGVFGMLVAGLACFEGLEVKGGAVGVGRATTMTVVKSIVALIAADAVFTGVFYVLGW